MYWQAARRKAMQRTMKRSMMGTCALCLELESKGKIKQDPENDRGGVNGDI